MRNVTHRGRAAVVAVTLAALALVVIVPAAAASGSSPVRWSPAQSTYGGTGFVAVPAPAPEGTGMTQPPGPPPFTGVAFGSGFWTSATEVFAFGFINQVPTYSGMPPFADTELSGTPLTPGTILKLVFTKTAGRRINSIAIIGAPDARVALDYAPAASLTESSTFTVWATVTDPVASAGGNVGAAFGLVMDCSTNAARDYHGSLFVANMHWLDVQPPSFSASGMAGLSANGANGTTATFDGIFAPTFLAVMGITDPTRMQGYVDATAVTGWPGATFSVLGSGDGSLWPAGYWKYRITNSSWSRHDIMFGRLTKPAKATAVSPKGTIRGTRPTFKWRKLGTATKYEVRVYKGAKLLQKKTGCSKLSWKAGRALPRGRSLTWKVRGANGVGAGAWSAALKFRIR